MKSREHVTTNGRAVFYASLWEDLRRAALSHGWALGLHGSLATDMDIMAMPWDEKASPAIEMIHSLCDCFTGTDWLKQTLQISTDKPNNRVVYTLSIFADFYMDINIIQYDVDYKIKALEERLEAAQFPDTEGDGYVFCGKCGQRIPFS